MVRKNYRLEFCEHGIHVVSLMGYKKNKPSLGEIFPEAEKTPLKHSDCYTETGEGWLALLSETYERFSLPGGDAEKASICEGGEYRQVIIDVASDDMVKTNEALDGIIGRFKLLECEQSDILPADVVRLRLNNLFLAYELYMGG